MNSFPKATCSKRSVKPLTCKTTLSGLTRDERQIVLQNQLAVITTRQLCKSLCDVDTSFPDVYISERLYGHVMNEIISEFEPDKGYVSKQLLDQFVFMHPPRLQRYAQHYMYKLFGNDDLSVVIMMKEFFLRLRDRMEFIKIYSNMSRKLKKEKKVKKFRTQSIEGLSQFLVGIRLVVKVLQSVGKEAKKVPQLPDFDVWSLVRLLLDLANIIEVGFSWTGIVNTLVSLYSMFCPKFDFTTQGMDMLLISAATMLLPNKLFEIVRRISLLSNMKVCDDKSYFAQFFVMIIEYLRAFVTYLPERVSKVLLPWIDAIPFGSHFIAVDRAEKLLSRWNKDKSEMLKDTFRLDVINVDNSLKDAKVVEWARRSAAVAAVLKDFGHMRKSVAAYESTSRIEPACFVFEGGPGCGKSVTMSQLITAMGKSAYCHTVKAVGDGKDFHDTYNYEYIYYMDDVGQQGISQFRTLINLVSNVKYPLDCAQAELKDTKFFCSPVIMFTTNQFSTLSNFSKNDGIATPSALWRRGYVFNFHTKMEEDGTMSGVISFSFYDPVQKEWRYRLPAGLTGDSDFKLTGNRVDHLRWMYNIITQIEEQKRNHVNKSSLSQKEIDAITFSDATTQGFGSVVGKMRSSIKWILDYFYSFIVDVFSVDFSVSSLCGKIVFSMLISVFLYSFYNFLFVKGEPLVFKSQAYASVSAEVRKHCESEKKTTIVQSLKKNLRFVELRNDVTKCETIALMSGHCVMLPYHNNLAGDVVISVFSDVNSNTKEIDCLPVVKVYENKCADVCIWRMPSSIASCYKNMHRLVANTSKNDCLITPCGVVDVEMMRRTPFEVHYEHSELHGRMPFRNFLPREQVVMYDFTATGACGSLLVDSVSGVSGMHVAGSDNTGISVLWSDTVRNEIKNVFLKDDKYLLNVEILPRQHEGLNVMRLESDDFASVPKKSKLVPSKAHGIFPVERFPANLSANGPCTVKDIAKKSMQHVGYVQSGDINFAKDYIRTVIEPFGPITMKEVICGNDSLARLNKDSSNGYRCLKDKTDYVDYDKGELTAFGMKEYSRVRSAILSGNLDYRDVIWTETLKDELRDLKKVDTPRSFRCSTVMMQIITKEIFGNMVSQIMRNRWRNGVCVGMNPLRDFGRIRSLLVSKQSKWALDFKNWDGKMLPQVQHAIASVIVDRVIGEENKKIASFILQNMPHSVVLVMDDLYQTNHSMPSGSFLTAILNSLVNKFLTACWYHSVCCKLQRRVSIVEFVTEIIDFVYGDDRVNATSLVGFDGCSMAEYFRSIGLDVTDDKKNSEVHSTYNIEEISFLKRTFEYNATLKKVVCPLSKKTLLSSLSWYMSDKDAQTVLRDKLDAFQREAFLHNDYEILMSHLKTGLESRGIKHTFRSEYELEAMVLSEDDEYIANFSRIYV